MIAIPEESNEYTFSQKKNTNDATTNVAKIIALPPMPCRFAGVSFAVASIDLSLRRYEQSDTRSAVAALSVACHGDSCWLRSFLPLATFVNPTIGRFGVPRRTTATPIPADARHEVGADSLIVQPSARERTPVSPPPPRGPQTPRGEHAANISQRFPVRSLRES